jgi:hypothetical protein
MEATQVEDPWIVNSLTAQGDSFYDFIPRPTCFTTTKLVLEQAELLSAEWAV